MPDNENLLNTQELEDSVSIDNLTQSPDLDGDDVVVLVHENNGVKSTYKAILRSIANFINKLLHYSSDLHTQNDTIIGAINELADGGGGSADIISEASGSIATFNDGGDNIPVKSLSTDIVAVQAGTGTPSPSNVRSISGFDEVDVVVTGKNLFDKTNSSNILGCYLARIGDDYKIASGTGVFTAFVKCKPNTTYTVSKIAGSRFIIGWTTELPDVNVTYYDYTAGSSSSSLTVTTGNNAKYIVAYFFNSTYPDGHTYNDYLNSLQIEENNQATTYEPFGTTHTITLPETIYGASLECVSGSGYSDGVLINLANYTGRVRAVGENENKYFRFEELSDSPDLTKRTLLLCDKFPLVEMSVNNTNIGVDIIEPSTLGYTVIAFRPPNVTSYTTQTVMDYIRNTLNGLQVCYRKATPTTITTTPEQIPTLGNGQTNNIYSNSGDVEVEYFNENADQTSELIDVKQEYANYSSEEKVVGKWLDGSPLYEKTLLFNNVKLDKTDSTSELVHGIENIGSVRFVAEVYFDFSGGVNGWSPANNGLWNNGVYNFYWVCGETSLYILSASGVYFDANPNRSYLVKIRYTKA